ncbi:MAG: cytidine deaminase [Nanoarchaeota archaeon]|nr:cytidine deaminase [Nanoarchaeota archaeon]
MEKFSDEQLIQKAKEAAKLHKSSEDVRIGEVGCALISEKGNLYLGVSIHACCGIGFCAEHSAIASMVLNQEYKIKKIVAVCGDGTILPPCGRCREFMYRINKENLKTEIIIGKNKAVKLKELLPHPWN